jgi:hypothetical protein
MPSVSSYKNVIRPLTIPDQDSPDLDLHLHYRPRAITPKMERAFQELQASGEADRVVYDSLKALIVQWDLTDDQGVVIPLEPEPLSDVPSDLLLHVFRKIQEDLRPDPTKLRALPNGSVAVQATAPTQTGTSFTS